MKTANARASRARNLLPVFLLLALLIGGNAVKILAHGGEDHSNEKPKVAVTEKGTVSRSTRLGDFEITFKTPALEPDLATAARLFVTNYETNEAIGGDGVIPTMEVEAAGGAVITPIAVEKTDTAGSYNLKIPALPEGTYTIRAILKTSKGSDTATFSSVEVASSATETATGSELTSWLGTVLRFFVGMIILGLFAGLFYLAWRMGSEKPIAEKTVSA